MEEGMGVDCCGCCSLGMGFFSLLPHMVDLKVPMNVAVVDGLSTGTSGDSRSHHWRLVVDRNVAYHLTYNAGKSQNKSRKRCEHQNLNPGG
jgi:hypothetical protein